ncbi:glycosyltransferase, partial [Escherichia coli]|nr:glycosyltransferase [Escherichia coli]
AETYANMDLFIFPSETDAFGNVVQEANASGVPAIVTDKGGPKFVVQNGITGFIASDSEQFAEYTIRLMDNPAERSKIAQAALKFARS